MRFSISAAALMASGAAAQLATIIPCPQANGTNATLSYAPITVTSQYQPVSTCVPTSACLRGSCTTKYPFSTFDFVSTTIPAFYNGSTISSTLVTVTTQKVTVSVHSSTVTSYITPNATTASNGTTITPTPSPVYLTVVKDYYAPYNQIGPLAIPGYEGSGLCTTCGVQDDGSRSQVVDVTECRLGAYGAKCLGYQETWVSSSAQPAATSVLVDAVSVSTTVPTPGTYTFTFSLTADAAVITSDSSTITVGPQPYFAHVTRVFYKHLEVVDITVTVTKTIYITVPCSIQAPTTASAVAIPTGGQWQGHWPWWAHHDHGYGGGYPFGRDPFGGLDWGNPRNTDWIHWFTVTVTDTETDTVTASMSSTASIGPISVTATASSTSFTSTSSTSSPSSTSTTSSSSTSTSTSSTSSSSSTSTSSSTSSTSTTSSTSSSTSSSSSSSVTSSSSTSSSSTTTTTPAVTTTFIIEAITTGAARYRKRAIDYVRFDGEGLGEIESDIFLAAEFTLDTAGDLAAGGLFVDTDNDNAYMAFELSSTRPTADDASFSIDSTSGELFISGTNHGFCVDGTSHLFILYSDTTAELPFPCTPVTLDTGRLHY
ncbi:hypothetical protein LTR44_000752 [Exophiala sp. CCFEE 6388]|nr:hypothetical protein LTR44_000752 [Eurotiomycetes sp. CCFEE 6388]